MKHIQQETRCRVQIKGRGSGFMEHATGQESNEVMYLHVAYVAIFLCFDLLLITDSGPDPKEVERAKELCEDLLGNVKEQYERFKANPPQQRGYGGGYQQGDRQGYNNVYGGYGGQQSPAPAAQAPPPGTPAAPGASSSTDYSAQYVGGADPYAAYGGYQNYVAYYQYYQQAYAAQQAQAGAPGATPPAPPGEAPPPPPPSGSPPATNGGYNAVSPVTQDYDLGLFS